MRLDAGDQEGVQADLQVYLERFGSTSAAGEARLTLGQVTADLGDLDAAVEVLEPIAGDVGSPLGAQAAALLAAISEDAGNLQAAEGLYERLADRARLSFLVRDALADEARLRAAQGDHEAAVDPLRPPAGGDGRGGSGKRGRGDAPGGGGGGAELGGPRQGPNAGLAALGGPHWWRSGVPENDGLSRRHPLVCPHEAKTSHNMYYVKS